MNNKKLKKHIKSIISVICVLALTIQVFSGYSDLIVRASDSAEPVQLVFHDATKMGADAENRPLYSDAFLTAGANASIVTDSDSGKTYMKTETTSVDPQYWLYFNGLCESGTLDLDAYPYIKISYRNMSSTATWDSAYIMAFSDAFNEHIQYEFYPYDTDSAEGNGSWNEVILDMNALTASYTVTPNNGTTLAEQQNSWTGNCSQIRFDFTGRNGIEIDIAYIAFFGSQEEAESYTGESADETLKQSIVFNDATELGLDAENRPLYSDAFLTAGANASIVTDSDSGKTYMKTETTSADPQYWLYFNSLCESGTLDLDAYPYIKISYRNMSSTATWDSAYIMAFSDAFNEHIQYEFYPYDTDSAEGNGSWNEVILDMNALTASYTVTPNNGTTLAKQQNSWTGKCSQIRFDFTGRNEIEIDIEYIAFFANKEEAESYTGESADETLDPSLKQITFSDFDIEDDTYGVNTTGLDAFGQYSDSLNGTVLCGTVRFSNTPEAMFIYAADTEGNSAGWHGLRFQSSNGNGTLTLFNTRTDSAIMTFDPTIAGVQLTDTDLNLKISMEYIDNDGDGTEDDVKLGVWFADKLYNNQYVYINDLAPQLGSGLSVYVSTAESSLKLESVRLDEDENEDKEEDVNVPQETLDPSLTQITFSKFGIANDTYGINTTVGLAVNGQYRDSLNGTVLSGNVRFSNTPEAMLIYGAIEGWKGLRLQSSNGDGTLTLFNTYTDSAIMTFDPEVAGVQLTDNAFNLKISTVFIDHDNDGAEDDVKLGVWFADKLYNNKYIYIDDYAPNIGNELSVYVSTEAASLKLESVQLNEKLETIGSHLTRITANNFGIADGKYKFTEEGMLKTGFETSGAYVFSLEDTCFSADVEFSSVTGASLHYGGGESAWHGIRLDIMWDGSMRVCDAAYNAEEGDKIYYLYSGIAGVQLTDTRYNLKLTTEYVDSDGDGAEDDVKFGIWFNDVLYNQEYIYFPNYALEMGSNFTICSSQENPESYIYVQSDANVKIVVDFSLYGFTTNWNKELGKEI